MVYLIFKVVFGFFCERFRTTNCYGLSFLFPAVQQEAPSFPYNELLWFIAGCEELYKSSIVVSVQRIVMVYQETSTTDGH